MSVEGGHVPADVASLIAAVRASVPTAMRDLPQWLLWRLESYAGDKKPRKVPYYVSGRKRTGTQGSLDDRGELASFEIALTHLARGHYSGLGFAFLPGDGLVGIDIDGAIDADGVVSDRCQAIIDACASYTELSPSGRGVHIICHGETVTFKDNRIGLEVFCGRQYFTVTGRAWPGAAPQVVPLAEKTLARLKATVASAKPAAAARKAAPAAQASGISDFERVNAAALALLDVWVPSMFPSATRAGTGAWRVKSRDLGRQLQEDLSLHPSGISDFGEERGLTPIDVVVKFAGKTPLEALRWMAAAIGLALTTKANKAAKRAAAGPSREDDEGAIDAEPDEGGKPPQRPPPEPWRKRLLRTSEGGIKDCRENVFTFLTCHPDLQGLLGYDEFAHRVMKLKVPPWDSEVGEWSTNDDYLLGFWLAQRERLTVRSEATLVAGVGMAAFAGRFHPVLRYLDALPAWDGTPRLGHWLAECLGAAADDYTRLVGAWFVMGMVKRVREPGCQMDYMVVLEGLQGKRKSTALRCLAVRDEWFADTPVRVGTPDAVLSIAGKWLYEIAELDSFNRAEATAVKSYVSSREDRVREPYARRFVDRKRSGVFAGTTNQSEYFKDPTGARRFWPVACDGDIDLDKLRAWREQLFAEALVRLASPDAEERRCWPTRAEEDQYLVPQQERREIMDPWYERLAMWLDCKAAYGETGLEVREVESFTAFELLTRCLMVPQDRIDGGRQMATRVGIAMHKLAWDKRRDPGGARVYRYYRPKAAKAGIAGVGPSGGPDGVQEPAAEVLHEF